MYPCLRQQSRLPLQQPGAGPQRAQTSLGVHGRRRLGERHPGAQGEAGHRHQARDGPLAGAGRAVQEGGRDEQDVQGADHGVHVEDKRAGEEGGHHDQVNDVLQLHFVTHRWQQQQQQQQQQL